MDIFLLGAGRPAHGQNPSALKKIALNTSAMDWQIRSFKSVANPRNIHYLGGYHVDDVIQNYPYLNFTVIPDWQEKSILDTLFKAPFSDRPAFISYSDTIFREEVVKGMLLVDADIVFCIDSHWKNRYELRSLEDINSAETITVEDEAGLSTEVEFTGLVYFKKDAVRTLLMLEKFSKDSNMVELLFQLKRSGLSVKHFDARGNWSEFNSQRDIARLILGTKAETLARLEPIVRKSHIGKQICFSAGQWIKDSSTVMKQISSRFGDAGLIVRSSSAKEDGWASSNAGVFKSILNIDGIDQIAISQAVDEVISSYAPGHCIEEQILIQEYINNVNVSGVVFTCSLESGAPYYRINFDDKTQSTQSVTAGTRTDLRTVIVSRFATQYLSKVEPILVKVLEAVEELEDLLCYDKLDIEFAIDEHGGVHIFQVRPITVDHSEYESALSAVRSSLEATEMYWQEQQPEPPYMLGEQTLFANMPDWNPAEIIGTRPKPLAFSLYRHLISNEIWAQQRAEYGYKDIRPAPLICSLAGQPYVDVRASFNSFIPANLDDSSARRLVNAYIQILAENPEFHDKIEFEVVFTIWTRNFVQLASQRLLPYGVKPADILKLEDELKSITRIALTRLADDISTIELLNERRIEIEKSSLANIAKIYALIDDCKRFGTLAFAHAARSGFVATALLKSMVSSGVLTEKRHLAFLTSCNTVTRDFEKDKNALTAGRMTMAELKERYGHLRPGTYEVSTQAYWEDPQRFLVSVNNNEPDMETFFEFSSTELTGIKKLLGELGSVLDESSFVNFLREAIRTRELIKFKFTKNLSRALDLCVEVGKGLDIDRDDLSYINYHDLEQLKLNCESINEIKERINIRKRDYLVTKLIELPMLIQSSVDVFCFERHSAQPNFVTANRVVALAQLLDSEENMELDGVLVLISQADPGYDWLFGHGIAGLITKYGGANSHMAIRAAEIGLPAAIGVGDMLFEQISCMKRIELDCANHTIREVP